ncbi:MAG: type I 3-dehydroquinate dehydratase [Promethearchaeota archaeon]
MKYNICVPIQVKSVDLSEITPTINKVIKLKPDFVELRFDYISDIEKITKDFIISLINQIQPQIPVICTFREKSEGGQREIEINERRQIIELIIESKPKFVDIEINTENQVLRDLILLASQNEVIPILSYHDFERTPSYEEVSNILENSFKRLKNLLLVSEKILNKSIFKLIFIAHSFEDNIVPLKLCKLNSSKNSRIISFCMGDQGLFSRILCPFSGSLLTFSSLDEKTAPGQVNIIKIREILNLLNF